MKVYISGGAKNGKSKLAQDIAQLLAEYEIVELDSSNMPTGKNRRETPLPLYYVATMIPTDDEDRARITRHVRERAGLGFTTIERSKNISGIIKTDSEEITEDARSSAGYCDSEGVFLLDSVTALLANVMFPPSIDNRDAGKSGTAEDMERDAESDSWFNPNAAEEVATDLKSFLEKAKNVILVSDYIYADPVSGRKSNNDEVDYTGTYIRGLSYIDRKIAALCDYVYEVSAGIYVAVKNAR